MGTIKTIILTVLLSVTTCLWVMFSAESFTSHISESNFISVVSYIFTFFLFWGLWVVIGTRYLNIKKEE